MDMVEASLEENEPKDAEWELDLETQPTKEPQPRQLEVPSPLLESRRRPRPEQAPQQEPTFHCQIQAV